MFVCSALVQQQQLRNFFRDVGKKHTSSGPRGVFAGCSLTVVALYGKGAIKYTALLSKLPQTKTNFHSKARHNGAHQLSNCSKMPRSQNREETGWWPLTARGQ